MYAECVLAGRWHELYYVFSDNVEKAIEYKGYYFYDLLDSDFKFKIDLEMKQITFYERIDGEWEDSIVIDMD